MTSLGWNPKRPLSTHSGHQIEQPCLPIVNCTRYRNHLTAPAAASSAPVEPICEREFGLRLKPALVGPAEQGSLTMIKLGTLGSTAAAIALAFGGSATTAILVTPEPAHADDCLLDTNNDGDADVTIDTDGGASSSGVDSDHT